MDRTITVSPSKAPTIGFNPVGSPFNANGWAKANFNVTVTATDYSGHGISSVKYCTTTSTTGCEPSSISTLSSFNVMISTESSNNIICAQAISAYQGQTGGTTCSSAYKLDKTYPTNNSISINGGASYTTTTSVTLTLSSSGATEMCISNTSTCGGTWIAYATSKSHTLTSGTGSKSVYVWYRDAAGNETSSIRDTITYKTTYTITYYAGSGSGSMSSTTCNFNQNCTISNNAFTRTGYNFSYWSGSNGSTYSNGGTLYNANDISLTANWSIKQFTITYLAGSGGSGSMSNTICNYNTACTLRSNSFTRSGYYYFNVWSGSNGSNYSNGSTVYLTSDLTLTAQWYYSPPTYTITYYAGSGSGSMSSTTCNYNSACSIKYNSFSSPGSYYSFSYWSGSNGSSYSGGSTVYLTSNLSLTAQWQYNPPSESCSGTWYYLRSGSWKWYNSNGAYNGEFCSGACVCFSRSSTTLSGYKHYQVLNVTKNRYVRGFEAGDFTSYWSKNGCSSTYIVATYNPDNLPCGVRGW